MSGDENNAGGAGLAGVTDSDSQRETPSPAAQRALDEAEQRRREQAENAKNQAKELGGRKGPDPARYGDWEKGGIVSDF